MKRLSLLFLLACGAGPNVVLEDPTDETADPERWSQSREAPEDVVPGASVKATDVIPADDVGKTFGTADEDVPYPDTYWPFTDGGIGANWNGADSPLHKYMQLFDPARLAAAYDWEQRQHGPQTPGVANWWGHCPGWTAAAITNAPLSRGVDAKVVNGRAQARTPGDVGCVRFELGDLNALMAEVYVDAHSSFIGARCDIEPSKIERDSHGRVMQNGCKGLNPGSLMVVLADRMKKNKLAMAIDAQQPSTTDQIWNQPAFRYTVYRHETLTQKQAAQRVSGKQEVTKYKWNKRAFGWVFVDIGIHWVTERGPNRAPVSGLSSQHETRFTAVLELDRPTSWQSAKVIGGEYVDDPSVGTDRLRVAPFVWVPEDSGYDNLPLDVDGSSHNPYLKFSAVKALVELTR